jgi:hypothetical protein
VQPFTARLAEVSAYENHNTVSLACSDAGFDGAYRMLHAYEIRPRKDHCGVDLISNALPFGRCGTVSQTQSATQLTTQGFSAGHIAPSFAFTMKRAT